MEIANQQIIAAIIGGVFLIISTLIRVRSNNDRSATKTPSVEDDKGENKEKEKKPRKKFFAFFGFNVTDGESEKNGKKIKTFQIFFLSIGIIFFAFALISFIAGFYTKIPTVTGNDTIIEPPNTNIENIGVSENLNFRNWYPWGNNLVAVRNGNTVTFNGMVNDAGYVSEQLSQNLRGKTVMLVITNAEESAFSEERLMKITVNNGDRLLIPKNVPDLIEKEYIPSDYKLVEFVLPDDFDGKLGFVFYHADLKDLQITATYR